MVFLVKASKGLKEGEELVRFPNSLCCELGERSVKNRGIEVLRSVVAKIYIESG